MRSITKSSLSATALSFPVSAIPPPLLGRSTNRRRFGTGDGALSMGSSTAS
jgi:hypothetical protein